MISNSQSVEMLPLVDERGTVIGVATRAECHSLLKLLHPVVHLHVVNRRGDILLQKRSMSKLIQPGRWDTAVGGHVDAGEDIASALMRESGEELGFRSFVPEKVDQYLFESPVERELVYSFVTVVDADASAFDYSRDEIDEVKFFNHDEIMQNRDSMIFTPNFLLEYDRISGKIAEVIKKYDRGNE